MNDDFWVLTQLCSGEGQWAQTMSRKLEVGRKLVDNELAEGALEFKNGSP